MSSPHIPVLLEEVLQRLDIHPGDIVVDGTLGFAGHAYEMAKALQNEGQFIGIDQDPEAILFSQQKLSAFQNSQLITDNYSNLPHILDHLGVPKVNKLLLDIGVSSWQIDQAKRGFSFQKDGPLDMRMSPKNPKSAQTILATYSAEELLAVFKNYGELYPAQTLVKNIVEWRKTTPFFTTTDLTRVIKKSFYFNNQRAKMMKTFAQVFQALRIEVNQELDVLTHVLKILPDRIAIQGRVAIITFHSLEDRIVKQFFKAHKTAFKSVGSKLKPSYHDAKDNPRARSAVLRVYERVMDE
jgi:16S rRNA (cytosine1402-N4)-methyltransferase